MDVLVSCFSELDIQSKYQLQLLSTSTTITISTRRFFHNEPTGYAWQLTISRLEHTILAKVGAGHDHHGTREG